MAEKTQPLIRMVYWPKDDEQKRRHTSWLRWDCAANPPKNFGKIEKVEVWEELKLPKRKQAKRENTKAEDKLFALAANIHENRCGPNCTDPFTPNDLKDAIKLSKPRSKRKKLVVERESEIKSITPTCLCGHFEFCSSCAPGLIKRRKKKPKAKKKPCGLVHTGACSWGKCA